MQVSSLLISEQLREKIHGVLVQENLRMEEKLFVRRYITTCLIYRNAHRPGAITNMMLAEWEAHTTSGNDGAVVSVKDHKTRASHGSANVVVPEHILSLIPTYIVSCSNDTNPSF